VRNPLVDDRSSPRRQVRHYRMFACPGSRLLAKVSYREGRLGKETHLTLLNGTLGSAPHFF
jgi:hypothetical protein